jgi:hypothetical protein
MLLNDLDPVTICRFIIAILDKRFQKLFTLFMRYGCLVMTERL